jgi:phage terminase large subunit-like protein
MATGHLNKLEKQAANLEKMLRKARRLAKGGDPDRGGGWNKKSVDEHLRDGTYRRSRHGEKFDPGTVFHPRPEHLPPEERCVPEWCKTIWQARGVWTPQDDLAIEQGCWFDPRFARHFWQFGRRYLRLWEGSQWAGQPFRLMRWQFVDVFAPLFGWFRWDDEWKRPVRRFNRTYIEVAKKNGKSPMAAYVGAYMMAADGEPGGKVFSAASSKDQASIVHEHAIQMVRNSTELLNRCKINGTTKTISWLPDQSAYRALSSEAGTSEGLNGHCCIADELHIWFGRKLWDALRYMGASRPQPISFVITTAGDDTQSVCFEQREYALSVARGDVEDIGFLGYVRAAHPNDDPGDPETWAKANPSMGVTVRRSDLETTYKEACKSAAALSSFKRYRLNIWGTAETPWLDMDAWDECRTDFSEGDLADVPVYAGLDLSKSRDMTALTLMAPMGEGVFWQLAYFWLPEDTVRKYRHRMDYEAWIKAGWLRTVPGSSMSSIDIRAAIVPVLEQFDVRQIVYDPYAARELVEKLTDEDGHVCLEFPQTIVRFAEPTATYEQLVLQRKLRHNGNPVLRWQAETCQVKADVNKNIRPVKRQHGDVRTIDGIVAGVMGLSAAMADDGGGVYADPNKELVLI